MLKIDLRLLEHDKAIGEILRKLEEPRQKKAVLFFRCQMFDAFSCIADVIRTAEKEIILQIRQLLICCQRREKE